MGLGQTILTIMSLMLMGRLILNVNTTTLDTGFAKDMAEYRISATSLGTSMLEKAEGLAFDEKTTISDVIVKTDFTAPASLTHEAGETTEDMFDDVDDYNGFITDDTVNATYRIIVAVEYVKINTATQKVEASTTQEFSKRIRVSVTSDFLIDYSIQPFKRDTLKFEKIFSYWYFR